MKKVISKILVSVILVAFTTLQVGCNQPTNNSNNDIMYDNIKEIKEKGYFKDSNDKIFNEYITSNHFVVFYDKNNTMDGIYAKSVIQELDNNYNKILSFFGLKDGSISKIEIYLYSNYDQFRMSIFRDIAFDVDDMGGAGGYTLGPNKLYLMYENNKYITMTAVHEFVHCVTFNFANSDMVPNWLFEGLAMYLSQDKDRYEDSYNEFAEMGFPPFYKFNDYANRYIYGYSLVEYIDTEFGREKLLDLIKSVNWDIEKVLEVSEYEFREGWKTYISKKINFATITNRPW